MNKEDLIIGEYYWWKPFSNPYIVILKEKGFKTVHNFIYLGVEKYYSKGSTNFGSSFPDNNNCRLATPEEKHWLNKCIELDKFITKDEAMKSFKLNVNVGDYLLCHTSLIVKGSHIEEATKGKIYKCENDNCFTDNSGDKNHGLSSNGKKWFELSTKEAYDAQYKPKLKTITLTIDKKNYHGEIVYKKGTTFIVEQEFENSYKVINPEILGKYEDKSLYIHKVYTEKPKEPEFVLPEKWCIKITKENKLFCQSLVNNELGFKEGYRYTIGAYYTGISTNQPGLGFTTLDYTEITFEQFKKYVLKEDIIESTLTITRSEIEEQVGYQYSLKHIEEALLKDYDKDDVKDIIKTLNKYLK